MSGAVLDPKSWRELRDGLRVLGAKRNRGKGSHEKWRFDDGETFIVVCNHLGDAVPLGTRIQFRRLRERRGATAGEEPAPLGRTGSEWSRLVPRNRKGWSIMGKGSSGVGKGGGGAPKGGGGPRGGGGGPKGGQGHGGNWPSTTGNPSGGGRGNAAPSK